MSEDQFRNALIIVLVMIWVSILWHGSARCEPAKTAVPPVTRYILPPLEYDYPYQGKLTIERVATVSELQDVCGVTKWLLGCSWRYGADSCRIVLVADDVIRRWNWTPELMMRHEMGHCNGWAGDHPGQRDYREPPGKPPQASRVAQ